MARYPVIKVNINRRIEAGFIFQARAFKPSLLMREHNSSISSRPNQCSTAQRLNAQRSYQENSDLSAAIKAWHERIGIPLSRLGCSWCSSSWMIWSADSPRLTNSRTARMAASSVKPSKYSFNCSVEAWAMIEAVGCGIPHFHWTKLYDLINRLFPDHSDQIKNSSILRPT